MNNKGIILTEKDFGPFSEFILDDNVTDIDFQGKDLWITDIKKGVYKTDLQIEESFVRRFTNLISDKMNKPFNQQEGNNVLEAETENLRIVIVNESVTNSGRSITIRKSLPTVRLNLNDFDSEHPYTCKEIAELLKKCVKAHLSFAFCGKPGVGKTEMLKAMTEYIKPNQKVVTIEDNPEIHYGELHPDRLFSELKISDNFSYTKAIKTALRLNTDWLMLSEARSREVKYLIEAWSTGISGMTTLHTDDVRKIPDRIKNMFGESKNSEYIENNIYDNLKVGILIKRKEDKEKGYIYRYLDQMAFFVRERDENNKIINKTYIIVDNGKIIENAKIPNEIKQKLKNIDN